MHRLEEIIEMESEEIRNNLIRLEEWKLHYILKMAVEALSIKAAMKKPASSLKEVNANLPLKLMSVSQVTLKLRPDPRWLSKCSGQVSVVREGPLSDRTV